MVNVVTVGRFKGKRIKADSESAFIPFGREYLDITYQNDEYGTKQEIP